MTPCVLENGTALHFGAYFIDKVQKVSISRFYFLKCVAFWKFQNSLKTHENISALVFYRSVNIYTHDKTTEANLLASQHLEKIRVLVLIVSRAKTKKKLF